jgi:hypothetical protein
MEKGTKEILISIAEKIKEHNKKPHLNYTDFITIMSYYRFDKKRCRVLLRLLQKEGLIERMNHKVLKVKV